MFKFRSLIILIVCVFLSCNKEKDSTLTTIKVNVESKYPRGNFEDYFSSSTMLPLETTYKSLVTSIDRISFSDNRIFILDKRTNSVIIFSNKGNFLNRIQNLGNGPGEYNNLVDFTVDKDKKQLILLTFAPGKVLVYDYKGVFVEEIKVKQKGYYANISYQNNKLLFVDKTHDKLFLEYNMVSKEKRTFVEKNTYDEFFSKLGSRFPFIIKSNNTSQITSLHSDIVYEYNNTKFYPKYKIDFGENKIPENIINNLDSNYSGIFMYMKENNYGFGVSNFRENKDYITFNFWNNSIVIYSKKLKEAKAFRSFYSPYDRIYASNYMAHDGNDNNLIFTYSADIFRKQLDIYKKKSDKWKEIPEYIKSFEGKIKSTDNPLLIIYKFK